MCVNVFIHTYVHMCVGMCVCVGMNMAAIVDKLLQYVSRCNAKNDYNLITSSSCGESKLEDRDILRLGVRICRASEFE